MDLSRLRTSLTKHGAHKIAFLIRDHDPGKILSLLHGKVPGINIEEIQARKNLSVGSDDLIPEVWREAKIVGSETVNALVLIAIIFSHYQLIGAMQKARTSKFSGRVNRGQVLDGKAYTNFAHTLEELGYSTKHTADYIDFDLQRLFNIPNLNLFALKVLRMKMLAAGWDGKGDIRQVLLDQNFHEVFAIDKSHFESWLSTGLVDDLSESLEDSDYFFDAAGPQPPSKYKFKYGHNKKKTGIVNVKTPINGKTAHLVHNFIQNKLDEQLVELYGRKCVGCEIATGLGTLIDVVVETASFRWFYEIKVANTVKACIRQAIPQLLEYAYWSADTVKVDKLIIVATHSLDEASDAYLKKLRDKFDLPLFYEQFVEIG